MCFFHRKEIPDNNNKELVNGIYYPFTTNKQFAPTKDSEYNGDLRSIPIYKKMKTSDTEKDVYFFLHSMTGTLLSFVFYTPMECGSNIFPFTNNHENKHDFYEKHKAGRNNMLNLFDCRYHTNELQS